MKVHILYMVFVFLNWHNAISQNDSYDFKSDIPITMSMTPLIDTSKLESEDTDFDILRFGDEHYNFKVLAHTIKNYSFGIVHRLDDGLPVYINMPFFRSLSFFDVNWNYEHKNLIFSVALNNILNFSSAKLEIEPSIERPSLVLEEIYFNQEATSMIQASIKYRF